MSTLQPESPGTSPARTGSPLPPAVGVSAIAARWAALHEAAAVVSALAGLLPEEPGAAVRAFPVAIAETGGWRRKLAGQGIEDLTLILQTGITALLAVHARGAGAAVPARALWNEFVAARDGLVALCPPEGQRRRPLG
jgi:hypothetical protein